MMVSDKMIKAAKWVSEPERGVLKITPKYIVAQSIVNAAWADWDFNNEDTWPVYHNELLLDLGNGMLVHQFEQGKDWQSFWKEWGVVRYCVSQDLMSTKGRMNDE